MTIEVSKYKTLLQTRLDELKKRMQTLEHDLDAPVSKDWSEMAVETEDSEAKEDLGVAAIEESRMINAALKRIDDGTFGICADCGEEISAERLDAVPYAVLCQVCAQKR